jgi:hypothetical protein
MFLIFALCLAQSLGSDFLKYLAQNQFLSSLSSTHSHCTIKSSLKKNKTLAWA